MSPDRVQGWWVAAGLWTWTVVAFASYLYQFRDLVGPVLRLLNISG